MLKSILNKFSKTDDSVPLNDYQIDYKTVLGMAINGSIVYKCRQQNTDFAIKKIRLQSEEEYTNIVREKDIWQQLQHQNIVKLIQHFEGKREANGVRAIYQVMELCETDLSMWFRHNTNRTLRECRKMVNEIIGGLCYLHSNQIMHRDLKPQNVLISLDKVCKIADFGISVTHVKTELNAHTNNVGTRLYAAPEQFDSLNGERTEYNLKVDVYSLGIILMDFFTLFESDIQKSESINELKNRGKIDEKFFEYHDKTSNISYYTGIDKLILFITKANAKYRPNINYVQKKLSDFIRPNAAHNCCTLFSNIEPYCIRSTDGIDLGVVFANPNNTIAELRSIIDSYHIFPGPLTTILNDLRKKVNVTFSYLFLNRHTNKHIDTALESSLTIKILDHNGYIYIASLHLPDNPLYYELTNITVINYYSQLHYSKALNIDRLVDEIPLVSLFQTSIGITTDAEPARITTNHASRERRISACVMISYVTGDARDRAEQIKRALESENITCFLDISDIPTDFSWHHILYHVIIGCEQFVALATRSRRHTEMTVQQLRRAAELKTPIFVINFLDNFSSNSVAMYLTTQMHFSPAVKISAVKDMAVDYWDESFAKPTARDIVNCIRYYNELSQKPNV